MVDDPALDPQSVQRRLAEAVACFRQGRYGDAAAAFGALHRLALPGRIEGMIARDWVLERLLASLYETHRNAEAFEIFARALPQHEPCGAEFDAVYLAALQSARVRVTPLSRRFRFHALARHLQETRGVPGEVAECGSGSGLSSFVLCSYLRLEDAAFAGAGYRLFDSFRGLSEPGPEDSIPAGHPDEKALRLNARAGNFAFSLGDLQQVLAGFPEVSYHAGWIPDCFAGLPERRYRFVHLDVDLYQPTRAALDYFFPRLAAGGMIVSDDFGWPGAQKAIREFSEEAGAACEVSAHNQARIFRTA